MLSASNLSLFSLVAESRKDTSCYRAPKPLHSPMVSMTQPSSRKAGDTLLIERESKENGARANEGEPAPCQNSRVKASKILRDDHNTSRSLVCEKLIVSWESLTGNFIPNSKSKYARRLFFPKARSNSSSLILDLAFTVQYPCLPCDS